MDKDYKKLEQRIAILEKRIDGLVEIVTDITSTNAEFSHATAGALTTLDRRVNTLADGLSFISEVLERTVKRQSKK